MARRKNPGEEPNITYRISVPAEDTDVVEWMNKQYSISTSMRQLIKMFVQEYGMRDVFCMEVPRGEKLGRPRADAQTDIPVPEQQTPAAPVVQLPKKDDSKVKESNSAISEMLAAGLMV